ncbi:hypothetical protein NC653_032494 [Populus alba x Populus x berolinensis]|uniref:Uncharacterized protein n=1 Tax=Populus alba x Populus x berolinensis TaxID=444605 RepID=A0AAD6LUE2_9ROSI|nr:hypothetical protein NC653_032494 [Populus alba x Populus x berolinensis]
MGRKQTVPELGRYGLLALFVMGTISCCMVYLCFSALFRPPNSNTEFVVSKVSDGLKSEDADGDCCRGIEHLELWGDAVKWGSEFKVNSSKACCLACKGMCSGDSGPCLCDSWVFCGDKQACGDKFGECWLKKQKDTLEPDRLDSGDHVMWTSGIVFGRGEGIIGLETEYGTLHLKVSVHCVLGYLTFAYMLLLGMSSQTIFLITYAYDSNLHDLLNGSDLKKMLLYFLLN